MDEVEGNHLKRGLKDYTDFIVIDKLDEGLT